MPDTSDIESLLAPPSNPATDMGTAISHLARHLAPNIMSLLGGEQAPPPAPLAEAPGKTPSTDDPRIAGALSEGAQGGIAALSMMGPGGAVASGGRALETMGGRAAAEGARSSEALSMFGAGAALTGATSDPAEAANLTRSQKRELEFKREQLRIESQAASERAEKAAEQETKLRRENSHIEADAKRQEAEDAKRIALEKQEEEGRITREHESKQANRPFREKFPNLSTAMSNAGLALSALLPYGTRMWQAGKATQFTKQWENVALQAEEAISKNDLPKARQLVDQLSGFKKQAAAIEKGAPNKEKTNLGLFAASSALPFETSALPEAIDLGSGSPEAKSRAKDQLLDPVRAPAALAQGATAALLGSKAPLARRHGPDAGALRASTEGSTKTYKALVRERVSQAKKAGRKLTPVEDDPFK